MDNFNMVPGLCHIDHFSFVYWLFRVHKTWLMELEEDWNDVSPGRNSIKGRNPFYWWNRTGRNHNHKKNKPSIRLWTGAFIVLKPCVLLLHYSSIIVICPNVVSFYIWCIGWITFANETPLRVSTIGISTDIVIIEMDFQIRIHVYVQERNSH